MIGRLEGRIHEVEPGTILVDVGGVGYLVSTPLRPMEAAGSGTTSLWIHTQLRDDSITLFGFADRGELVAFEKLIAVAGVGPRIALAVLSTMSAGELAATVERGDLARLVRTPGVGRKIAERILLELKGRLGAGAQGAPGERGSDALSALVNLGYGERDAARAVAAVVAEGDDLELAEVLRLALQRLTR